MTHLSPTTLGDLKDDGYRLSFYCDACYRTLDIDLDKAIELWGRGLEYAGHRWPIKCASCGSRQVGVRLSPGLYRDMKKGKR